MHIWSPSSPTAATRRDGGQVRSARAANRSAPVLPEEPLLVAPSVAELLAALEGTVIAGDSALLSREAMHVLVAGMTAEHVLERLNEGSP